MITLTFRLVATVLYNLGQLFGLTYNEVNVLAYYLLIPLTWTVMLDTYIGLPLTTGALLYIWIGIRIGTWGTSASGATGPSCAQWISSTTSTVGEGTMY